jgi:hypothetical protein
MLDLGPQHPPAAAMAKAICSSVNFDFFIQDDLLTEILPQN